MKMLRSLVLAGAVALALGSAALLPSKQAAAQVPSNPAPYNVDLGALISNSLRPAGTVTTNAQANTNWRGVVCLMDIAASSGSPSASFKIQGYDAATASYYDMVQSASLTGYASSAPNPKAGLVVYPGAAASTPNGFTTVNAHLPRTWRISQTIQEGTGGTGKSPALTGHVGCNYLL